LPLVRRERCFLLTYEALVGNPAEQLSRIYSWLGVDASFVPTTLHTPAMVKPTELMQLGSALGRFARSRFYENTAQQALPRPVRAFVRTFASRTRIGVSRVRPAETPTRAAKDYLRRLLMPETEKLCRLLERAFPEWTTLYGTD
jgi:hypothetical protein